MTIFLLILIALAVGHFLYEEIISPWLRTERQFKLFAIRDELRRLKLEKGDEFDTHTFHELQNSVNVMIGHLPAFTITALAEAQHSLDKHPELRKRMEERAQRLDACPFADVKRLRKRSLNVAKQTVLVNAGAWLMYILPFLALKDCIRKTVKLLKGLVLLPERELEQLMPSSAASAAT
jgi:hypothetical protein